MEQFRRKTRFLRFFFVSCSSFRSSNRRRSKSTVCCGSMCQEDAPIARPTKVNGKGKRRSLFRRNRTTSNSTCSGTSSLFPTTTTFRTAAMEEYCGISSNNTFLLRGLPRHAASPTRRTPSSGRTTLPATTAIGGSRHKSKSQLEQALEDGCTPIGLHLLLEPWGPPLNVFKATGFLLDIDKARLLGRILPRVKRLECRPTSYTSEGLLYLLTSLQHKRLTRHLKELKLLQLPRKLLVRDQRICRALKRMLQENSSSFRTLQISLQQHVASPFHDANPFRPAGPSMNPDDTACFQAIQEGFASPAAAAAALDGDRRGGVEVLELVDFFVPSVHFTTFLASPSNPKVVRIRRFRIACSNIATSMPEEEEGEEDYTDSTCASTVAADNIYDGGTRTMVPISQQEYASASIQSLAMSGCALASDCVDEVFNCIASLPELEHLTCSVWKHIPCQPRRLLYGDHLHQSRHQQHYADYNYEAVDVTGAVVTMLRRGKLQSISSVTAHVRMPRVCSALASNASLKVMNLNCGGTRHQWTSKDEACLLQVLKDGNTTLADVSRLVCPQVRYYAALNKYGRAQAWDVKQTTAEGFVRLLGNVVNSSSCRELDSHVARTGVLYGLLKENPNLWCNSTS